MNKVQLSGNLTKDVNIETFDTADGRTYIKAYATIAVDGKYNRRTNQKETQFIPLQAWGPVAERLAQRCKRGTRLWLEGELNIERYDNNGTTQYFTYVDIKEFEEFIRTNTNPNAQGQTNAANPMAPAAHVNGAPAVNQAPMQTQAPVPAAVTPVENPQRYGYIGDDDENTQYTPKPLAPNKIW